MPLWGKDLFRFLGYKAVAPMEHINYSLLIDFFVLSPGIFGILVTTQYKFKPGKHFYKIGTIQIACSKSLLGDLVGFIQPLPAQGCVYLFFCNQYFQSLHQDKLSVIRLVVSTSRWKIAFQHLIRQSASCI